MNVSLSSDDLDEQRRSAMRTPLTQHLQGLALDGLYGEYIAHVASRFASSLRQGYKIIMGANDSDSRLMHFAMAARIGDFSVAMRCNDSNRDIVVATLGNLPA